MKISVFLIVMVFGMYVCSQTQDTSLKVAPLKQDYDGNWWFKTNVDERSGFINGASDCLTWSAHEDGFNATPEQITEEISRYYKVHPKSISLSVIDVWQKVTVRSNVTQAMSSPGETWKNAHWYLNGGWWNSISELEATGYLEGYLWCNNNKVHPQTESYSHSVSFYQKKIYSYINANHKSGNEAVADILRRYRDKVVVPSAKK